MIRRIAAGILALLVLLSASATAEYEQYRLAVPDEKDAVQLWEVFAYEKGNTSAAFPIQDPLTGSCS